MAKVKMIDDKPYWVDADGSLKPEECISNADKKKEEMIDAVFESVGETKEKMEKFKLWVWEVLTTYIEKLAKKARVDKSQGNFTIVNYDSTRRIRFSRRERQDFNENLQFAKAKFDEWVVKRQRELTKFLPNLFKRRLRSTRKAKSTAVFFSGCSAIRSMTRISRKLRSF